jgi:hypothetical protein
MIFKEFNILKNYQSVKFKDLFYFSHVRTNFEHIMFENHYTQYKAHIKDVTYRNNTNSK